MPYKPQLDTLLPELAGSGESLYSYSLQATGLKCSGHDTFVLLDETPSARL